MKGKRTIHQISLTNFLSYGPQGQTIELEPLNVLIGANSTGKSNFLEAFRFLHALPADLERHIRESGGIAELLWKGNEEAPQATLEVTLERTQKTTLIHKFSFTGKAGERFQISQEIISQSGQSGQSGKKQPLYEFPNGHGKARLLRHTAKKASNHAATVQVKPNYQHSVIGNFKSPVDYPDLTVLETLYSNLQFAGEWDVSRFGAARRSHRTDLLTETLLEDASNLGLVLFNFPSETKAAITHHLREVYEQLEEITFRIEGNSLQIRFKEKGLVQPIPLTRLSEGTLRYLCFVSDVAESNAAAADLPGSP